MDINQLNCFITVAQTLNFSEAARRSFVSQSTVSRYISDLEKEFGVQLFARSHRDVLLTNEGKTLLPYALEMLAALGKAKKTILEMQNGGVGKLTVGCDVTSFDFPSRCISDFTQQYTGVTIDLKQLNFADRSDAVTGGEYDFCFAPRDMVPEHAEIETLATHSEPLVVLAAADSLLGKHKAISLKDLSGQRLVLFSEAAAPILYMEIMDLLRTFHIAPKIENTYDDWNGICAAVLSHLGAAIVPQSLAAMVSPKKATLLFVTDADTEISYVVSWSKNNANPIANLFLNSVKKFADGDDGGYGL